MGFPEGDSGLGFLRGCWLWDCCCYCEGCDAFRIPVLERILCWGGVGFLGDFLEGEFCWVLFVDIWGRLECNGCRRQPLPLSGRGGVQTDFVGWGRFLGGVLGLFGRF